MAASKQSSSNSSSPGLTPFRRRGSSRSWLDERCLTCDICLEVLYNPTTVCQCNHKFCASCILQWASTNQTCPKCRIVIRSMTKDSFAQQIVDQYLETYPDRVRPAERLAAADKAELKFLEKLMNDDAIRLFNETDDDEVSWDDLLDATDRSFDLTSEPRVQVTTAYMREEMAARIERLRAMGVVSTPARQPPPGAGVPPGTPIPVADARRHNLRDFQNAIRRHFPIAVPANMPHAPIRDAIRAIAAARRPPVAPPLPPQPPVGHVPVLLPLFQQGIPVPAAAIPLPPNPPVNPRRRAAPRRISSSEEEAEQPVAVPQRAHRMMTRSQAAGRQQNAVAVYQVPVPRRRR